MRADRTGSTEPPWLHALAGGLLLGGPVWNALYRNGYPFDRPEAWVLPISAGLLGAGTAALSQRLDRRAGSLAFAALLLINLDLQYDIGVWPIRTILIAVLCVAVALLFAARRAALACIMLVAFHVSTAVLERPADSPTRSGGGRPSASRNPPVPLLVHLVLDEQWGIGGLRSAGDTATARFLTEFYMGRGFEVFEAAYSRSPNTEESMAGLMSLSEPMSIERLEPTRLRLQANPYFEHLAGLGYRVRVMQSSYLDYCHAVPDVVTSCSAAPAVSMANIGYLEGPWLTRAALVARFQLSASHLYRRLHGGDPASWRRSFAGRGLELLEEVERLVRTERGIALFVHVLLPHRPLEVDSTCTAHPADVKRVGYDPFERMSDGEWREVLARYGEQVRCVHNAVAEIIDAIDRTVGRDGAIVLVHGDHGSRLSPRDLTGVPLGELDPQQLNAVYSTLLAFRRPRGPAVVHTAPVPVQDFFWALVGQDFLSPRTGQWRHFVKHTGAAAASPPSDTIRFVPPVEMLWARSGS